VLLSPDEPLANADIHEVNVLIVTTVRSGYRPGKLDVMLNGADGLDHLSRVRVHPVYQISKKDLGRRRGCLSMTRRAVIARLIREVYRLG
jgi:hypothetical protein